MKDSRTRISRRSASRPSGCEIAAERARTIWWTHFGPPVARRQQRRTLRHDVSAAPHAIGTPKNRRSSLRLRFGATSWALHTNFPNTMVQTVVVKLIRDSLELASYQDRKAVADALRSIYTAQTIKAATDALKEFAKRAWGVRYPTIVQRWQ